MGFAGASGGYGVYGGTAVPGGYAGGFAGPVLVVGDFTATGGTKSAAVPHPDGTHRRLYCLESPESLFEDFGEARLVGGRAEVKLDPDFAAVVHNDKYFAFLTEVGDSGGLYVAGQRVRGPRQGLGIGRFQLLLSGRGHAQGYPRAAAGGGQGAGADQGAGQAPPAEATRVAEDPRAITASMLAESRARGLAS